MTYEYKCKCGTELKSERQHRRCPDCGEKNSWRWTNQLNSLGMPLFTATPMEVFKGERPRLEVFEHNDSCDTIMCKPHTLVILKKEKMAYYQLPDPPDSPILIRTAEIPFIFAQSIQDLIRERDELEQSFKNALDEVERHAQKVENQRKELAHLNKQATERKKTTKHWFDQYNEMKELLIKVVAGRDRLHADNERLQSILDKAVPPGISSEAFTGALGEEGDKLVDEWYKIVNGPMLDDIDGKAMAKIVGDERSPGNIIAYAMSWQRFKSERGLG